MNKLLCLIILLAYSFKGHGQDKVRQIKAVRTNQTINVDGELHEPSWASALPSSNFITSEPTPGLVANQQTEIKILYDNNAIYIGAFMKDEDPDQIFKNYSIRDNTGNADWMAVNFDTYQDGINAIALGVTAAGVQLDVKYSSNGEDGNWDVVFESAVSITEDGWYAELAIPYSALRFPETDIQNWNFQAIRHVRRNRETSYWQEFKPEINGFVNQFGNLNGIKDIKAPPRLSLTPFVLGGINFNKSEAGADYGNSYIYGAGMDLKYGINDAFTLDMTVIPDFSQVLSDEEVLNLSPFEVFFEERRQFFTEGIELFNKGDFFYSRRIGGNLFYKSQVNDNLDDEEKILNFSSNAQLINATKISGRNSNGTGIGFFNAIEAKSYANIETADGSIRKELIHPLTNYNVLVVDQNLKNNSYVSLSNTNVTRFGEAYDANVTGTNFSFRSKEQKYELQGRAAVSQQYDGDENTIGHNLTIGADKISGKYVYGASYRELSDQYDQNDLGFLFNNNQREMEAYFTIRNFEPEGPFSRIIFYLSPYYNRLYNPNKFTRAGINNNLFLLFPSFFAMGNFTSIEPTGYRDYFEPRTDDFSQFYKVPASWTVSPFISSSYSRPFAVDASVHFTKWSSEGRYLRRLRLSPRFNIGSRLNLIFSFVITDNPNDVGYVDKEEVANLLPNIEEDDVLLGIRERKTISNSLSLNYIFNEKMSVTARIRHYWDKVTYTGFGLLDNGGELASISFNGLNENGDPAFDQNFNLMTLDINYLWRYAPGSDIIVNFKNRSLVSNDQVDEDYFYNLSSVLDDSVNNNLTVKLLYFLDYQYLKK